MEEKINEECQTPNPQVQTESAESFKDLLGRGVLHSFITVIKYIFVLPWMLWKKSVIKMAEQHGNHMLDLDRINGFWPFLTFLKRFFIDFLFDACSVLSWFAVPILGIIFAISYGDFGVFLLYTAVAYFTPIGYAIVRDVLQLLIIPFRKFLSWGSRPAQYLEMDMNKKSEK